MQMRVFLHELRIILEGKLTTFVTRIKYCEWSNKSHNINSNFDSKHFRPMSENVLSTRKFISRRFAAWGDEIEWASIL